MERGTDGRGLLIVLWYALHAWDIEEDLGGGLGHGFGCGA